MSEEIRVRFPPSPTGYLHIGSARTALYNWLFARKHHGKLILRIEDTDTERSTEESARAILDGLEWMGMDWDEGPYNQSEHLPEHREVANRLLAEGKAYRCFCAKESIDAKRAAAEAAGRIHAYDGACRGIPKAESDARAAAGEQSVIRFRVPEGASVDFDDVVFGPISVKTSEIEDFVIVRSNGLPLYILSNLVDDHRDRITHVIRGQDHLTNTPRQVLLYRALGWPLPVFAHISLTLDPQKAKISKRKHGEIVTVEWYRDHGFLPWGFANFIALLGWSPGDGREAFLTREEMIQAFSLEGLGRTNAIFDCKKEGFPTDPKAIHVNGLHIRGMPIEELIPWVRGVLEKAGLYREEWSSGEGRAWFVSIVGLLRDRYQLLTDFAGLGRFCFADDYPMEQKALDKNLKKDPVVARELPNMARRLEALGTWDAASIEQAFRAAAEALNVKVGLLANASRAAVSGQTVGPALFDLMAVLGRDRCVARIDRVAASLAG